MGKKNWIKGAIKNPGAFTRKAKNRGISTAAFKNAVLKNPKKYDKKTVQQANLANTLAKFNTGGVYDNPTLPISTSTMAGMPGQQQAQQEFMNLQAQSRRAQRMNERAQELEQQAAEQQTKDEFNAARNQYGATATKGLGTALGAGADAFRAARYAKDAARMTDGVSDVSGLLGNLQKAPLTAGKQGLQGLGQGIKAGVGSLGPAAGGAILGLAGAGIDRLSDDQDETTMNVGETSGALLKGAGSGLGLAGTLTSLAPALAIPGLGWAAAGIGAGVAGVKALKNRNQAREDKAEQDRLDAIEQGRMGRSMNAAFRQGFTTSGQDLGYNTANSMSNAYLPGNQMFKNGGLIKRADGSYSPRGLWDNIRANKGSGKKPTAEMLKQEKKIKAQEKRYGGKYNNGGPAIQVSPEQQALFAQLNPTLNAQIQNMPQSNDRLTNYSQNQLAANENMVNKGRANQAINQGVQTGKAILSDPSLAMDAGQLALAGVAASEIPVASQAAGALNAGIYGARGAYYGAKGAMNSDAAYAAKGALYGGLGVMSAAGMVPGAGAAADASVIGSMASKLKSGLNAAHHTKAAHLAHEGSNIYKANNILDATSNTFKYGGKSVPGGKVASLPQGAKKFIGKSHEEGGIMIDPMTEVEGGETMDQVKMSDGDNSDYIFSKTLKLGGKSFAQRHEEIVRRGGSKQRVQRKIQQLAQMQEKVAAKEGKTENGPRDPNMIAQMQDGGPLEYLTSNVNFGEEGPLSPADPNDPNFVLDAASANLIDLPDTQSENPLGLYSDINKTDYEILKARNPWFDWGEGDLPSKGEIKKFQEEFKANTGRDIRIDDMLGEQTASAYIPYKRNQAAEVVADSPKTEKEKSAEEAETPTSETGTEKTTTPTTDKINMLPGAGAALLGLAQLPRKLKEPPRAANINAQQTGKIRLPRVNYNAERAAGQAGATAVNRQIQDSMGGPGKIAAMIANTNNQRVNNLNIAQAEAQANKQLAAQETMTNAQIAQQNAANVMGAQQFNEQSKYARDLEKYQQNLLRQQAVGDTIAGVGRDFMGYRADERLAAATDETGSYLRFMQNNPGLAKQLLSAMQNQQPEQTQENKYGGYIKRSKKIGRKKKK